TPPPQPPALPAWDGSAFSLSRTALYGSFPSDMVRRGRTLFAVDADQVEAEGALVRASDIGGTRLEPSTLFADTRIRVEDLRDAQGQPASLAAPIGFGFYLNDLLVASDTLAFVLANAAGSDGGPVLSNLVAFNPSTGQVRQVVNLAWEIRTGAPWIDSSGQASGRSELRQSGAEALAFLPTGAGYRLVVAMTNLLVDAPSYGAIKQRGTLQVWDVVPDAAQPVRPRSAPAGWATETLLTNDYNPVALAVHQAPSTPGAPGPLRLLVTLGGTTAYDTQGLLVPVTEASVEVYDAGSLAYEGRFRMGLAGLAGTSPALGRDAAGHLLGFYPSSVTGEIYVLRLDGLDSPAVDAARLAVLRGPGNGLPVSLDRAGTPGGNVTGCELSPDGRSLVIATFGDLYAWPTAQPGLLSILALPEDVVTGAGFGPAFLPGTSTYATVPGRTLGRVVLRPDSTGRPDVFVLVGGAIDPFTYLGSGPASVGALTTFGLVR
ncbi:MAG: hypothetical protein ACKOSS_03515, partial [Planctomycetia bacterium]